MMMSEQIPLPPFLAQLIANDDKPGDWQANVYAAKNVVAMFQCKSAEDAKLVAVYIAQERATRGLETHDATARQILAKSRAGLTFGTSIELLEPSAAKASTTP